MYDSDPVGLADPGDTGSAGVFPDRAEQIDCARTPVTVVEGP
jgi:hypothetical protein